MCWYYKINDIIKLQENQLRLQQTTVELLEKLVNANIKNQSNGSAPKVIPYRDPSLIKPTDIESSSNKLTDNESEILNSMIPMSSHNEIIVLNHVSRIIKKINKSDFKPGGNWIIVKEFEVW